jgi:hypothetical protein
MEYKFKEQDIAKATGECDDSSPCKPELVPTKDDEGNINFALLEAATPNADSLIGDGAWCPGRHCVEYLNDGFYNNCRSWISNTSPGTEAWAEIDLGDVYRIKKVAFGSDRCENYMDRAATKFSILVAKEYNEDSSATTWERVFDYDDTGNPIHTTTLFEFNPIEARYVRISVLDGVPGQVRIDEIEIYGTALTGTAVYPQGKLTTTWGQMKK